MLTHKKGHTHDYDVHPTWPTHVYCRVCGFAVTARALRSTFFRGRASTLGPTFTENARLRVEQIEPLTPITKEDP